MVTIRLYLVRHGEQDPASGHAADGGLSDHGREQADRLGRRLSGVAFSAIHHSPLRRAAETAAALAEHLSDVPRHPCDLVADRTPVPSPARRGEYPDRWLPWLDRVPANERDEDATALRAAVTALTTGDGRGGCELVVTHNFVIGWFVRHVLDAPTWRWIGLDSENCGLTVVRWDTDRPATLERFNDTAP